MKRSEIPVCDHCGETVFNPCKTSEVARGCVLRSCREAKLVREQATPSPSGVVKPTNPKDVVGIKKSPMSVISGVVLMEVALGFMEGALKYGRHNYRAAGIRASVYYDATMRHLMQWWEGEDLDPDSGLSHITKAICSLIVLRDAMIQDMITDDRPPKSPEGWMKGMNEKAARLIEQFPNPVPAVMEKT